MSWCSHVNFVHYLEIFDKYRNILGKKRALTMLVLDVSPDSHGKEAVTDAFKKAKDSNAQPILLGLYGSRKDSGRNWCADSEGRRL